MGWEICHVRKVYDGIAEHFSATRYKRWPVVDRFLADLPRGSLGMDLGCGNGKNLPKTAEEHQRQFCFGLDRQVPRLP